MHLVMYCKYLIIIINCNNNNKTFSNKIKNILKGQILRLIEPINQIILS